MKKIEPYSYLIGKVTYIRKGQYVPKKGYQFTLGLLVEGKKKNLNSVLPVVTYKKQIDFYNIKVNDFLVVFGSLLVLNKEKNSFLSVMAKKIDKISDEEYKKIILRKEENNKTVLIGYVSKFPIISKKVNGKGSYMKIVLAIEKEDQTFDLVPCVCAFTEQNSSSLIIGNKVCVVGRLESKNKTKGKNGVVKTIYEVFVTHSSKYKYE